MIFRQEAAGSYVPFSPRVLDKEVRYAPLLFGGGDTVVVVLS